MWFIIFSKSNKVILLRLFLLLEFLELLTSKEEEGSLTIIYYTFYLLIRTKVTSLIRFLALKVRISFIKLIKNLLYFNTSSYITFI